jgi:hypothetical protein
MSLESQFWTRIVIPVDSPIFSLSDIQSHLEWSRDLPIAVTITKRKAAFAERERDENRRVWNITMLLRPHAHRCQTIDYNVIHSSSLPMVSVDLYGSAPHFKRIHLESTRYSSNPSAAAVQRYLQPQEIFHFPALVSLSVGGLNFVNLCRNTPQFVEKIPNLHTLCVTHFGPSDAAGGRYSFHDAMQIFIRIPHLQSLTLSDVEFDFDLVVPVEEWIPDNHLIEFSSLNLTDLSGRLTAGILASFNAMDLDSVAIVRCSLETAWRKPHSESLTLEDIPDTEGICQYLSDWDGAHLEICDCLAFDDSVLEMLGATVPGSGFLHALELTNFTLRNCSNWSMESLKQMVEARHAEMCPLSSITVSGYIPPITTMERTWLTRNVETFTWYN